MFIGLAVTALFKVVNVPMQDTIEKFVQLATVTTENQKEHFSGPVENDVYQFSALPWITFTHIHTQIF
jgi:chloramphenicol O-acetyltransferase type B